MILDLLRSGARKEIAQSVEIANLLIENENNIKDYLQLLLKNHTDSTVISHGFFALKEASIKSETIRKESIQFIFKSISLFNQWEAKENFLRILLIRPEGITLKGKNLKVIKTFLDDQSSIVRAYTIEVLIRNSINTQSDITHWVEIGLNDHKAAVKARTRKIMKMLKLDTN